MLVGTHFCLPVIAAGISDWRRVRRDLSPRFSQVQLFLIGLGGILPDLSSIHISLEARHASLTHTLWFPAALLLPLAAFGLFARGRFFPTALLAWVGVALHLAADLVSGGIPLYGIPGPIVGAYYLHPGLWILLDAAFILATWYLFLLIRFRLSGGKLVCETCSWEEKILADWRESHQKALVRETPPADPPVQREDTPT